MSRYLILILLNMPFILAGIASATVAYKLKRINKKRFFLRVSFWVIILLGLIFSGSIYHYLFSNNLTTTEPLSLFDVIQITGVIVVSFFTNLSYTRIEKLEKKVQDLHQELSIKLSDMEINNK